ncbi:hypothetical protein Tco_0289418 [Tanacetum coccineum]
MSIRITQCQPYLSASYGISSIEPFVNDHIICLPLKLVSPQICDRRVNQPLSVLVICHPVEVEELRCYLEQMPPTPLGLFLFRFLILEDLGKATQSRNLGLIEAKHQQRDQSSFTSDISVQSATLSEGSMIWK